MKLLNNKLYIIWMKIMKAKVGKRLVIHGWPYIYRFPGTRIEIGDDVIINSSFLSNLVGLYQPTIIVTRHGGKVSIGNKVGISGSTIYSWDKIVIGDRTQIGANSKIVDTDFHALEQNERANESGAQTRPVIIGADVFIGMNTIILKGTKIGDGCVVGAGSVVSGEFPANSVIAGNPAKIIRDNVSTS